MYTPTAMRSFTCARCGAGFTTRHKRRFCKPDCRDVNWSTCACGASIRKGSTQCWPCAFPNSQGQQAKRDGICLMCMKPYRSRATKYCSKRCRAKMHSLITVRAVGPVFIKRPCRNCGTLFVVKASSPMVLCSPSCHAPSYRPQRGERHCRGCNVLFCPLYGTARYCTRRCRIRKERQGVPSVKHSITIDELGVRDGWVCHLCGEGVTLMDATRDHLIPQAQGGMHEPSNLKLAHRSCNSRRGARAVGSVGGRGT